MGKSKGGAEEIAMYHWRCPKCGTRLQLRKRVTITKRYCPHCNFEVKTADIDEQTKGARQAAIALLVGAAAIVIFGTLLIRLVSFLKP